MVPSASERVRSEYFEVIMYREIGRIISKNAATDGWGKCTVSSLATYIQSNIPSSNGFPIKTSGG